MTVSKPACVITGKTLLMWILCPLEIHSIRIIGSYIVTVNVTMALELSHAINEATSFELSESIKSLMLIVRSMAETKFYQIDKRIKKKITLYIHSFYIP